MQAVQLRLQGFELNLALQGLGGSVRRSIRRRRHWHAAVGIELGDGE